MCILKYVSLMQKRPWILISMNKSKNACTPTTLGAPLNRNQSRTFIFALSSLHFTVCYLALWVRAARDNHSVMKHYLCAKMCRRSSHPHTQCSTQASSVCHRVHMHNAVNNQCDIQYTTHQEHCIRQTNILFIGLVQWSCLPPVQRGFH